MVNTHKTIFLNNQNFRLSMVTIKRKLIENYLKCSTVISRGYSFLNKCIFQHVYESFRNEPFIFDFVISNIVASTIRVVNMHENFNMAEIE